MNLDRELSYEGKAPHSRGILGLNGLNHISRLSSDLEASKAFFIEVLGFRSIRRPSFDFDGSWLIGFGFGLHLIHSESARDSGPLDPRADHLSFTCASLQSVELKLLERRIPFVKQTVWEHGLRVSQVFFRDPGGSGMIEVCNCDCLPIIMLDEAAQVWQSGVETHDSCWISAPLASKSAHKEPAPQASMGSTASSLDGFEL